MKPPRRTPGSGSRIRPASRSVVRSTIRVSSSGPRPKSSGRIPRSTGLYLGAALGERSRRKRPGRFVAVLLGVAVLLAGGIAVRSGAGGTLWRQAGLVADRLHLGEAEVVVSGNRYLSDEEVMRAAGLERKVSFFDVDLESAGEQLEQNARIREARLERRFNGKIRVRIEERLPVAVVSGRELREVDREGRVLPPLLEGAVADLPVICGLDPPHKGSLADSDFERALRWLDALGEPGIGLGGRISEVDVSGSDETRIILDPDGTPVLLPATPGSLEGLCALRVVLADLESRSIRALRIDCRAEGMVVVRPAPGTQRARNSEPVAAKAGGEAATL